MKNNNVTFIDELPFLEEISSNERQNVPLDFIPSREYNQVKKFIRNTEYNLPSESGMNTKSQQMIDEQQLFKQQQIFEEQQKNYEEKQKILKQEKEYEEMLRNNEMIRRNNEEQFKIRENYNLSCIDVAEHVSNCIVCSKLYNNNNSIFYGAILVLVIICLILLKRVVEK